MLTPILSECLEAFTSNMISFAQKLITLPSVTGQEEAVAKAIVEEMQKLDYDEIIVDATGNVLGIIKGSGGAQHIVYNCHMDQVDPGNVDAWQYSPFSAQIAQGHIHGRGASDTKGAIAAQVYAAAAIKKAQVPHKGDIIVTAVVEEEPGSMWGMRRLCEDALTPYLKDTALVVLGEATGLNVYLGHRGRVEIELSTHGCIAHSSAPWRGKNAVYAMQPIVQAIEELDKNLPEHTELTRSSIAVTSITCSPAWLSTVPDVCTIRIDRRFLPHENEQSILAELEQIVRQAQLELGKDAHIRWVSFPHHSYTGIKEEEALYKPAFITDKESSSVKLTFQTLQSIGQQPQWGTWDFGTDGAFTATKYGIPTIGYAPCEEQYAHTPLDRVSIDLMQQSLSGYAAISLAVTNAKL